MEATAADWITAGFTVVLAIVTGVLAVATGLYVRQTERLVKETRKSRKEAERGRKQSAQDNRLMREEMAAGREESRLAREQSVLPKLAVSFEYRGPTIAFATIRNVGLGAAIDVDVELVFEPLEGSSQERDARLWRTNLMVPGDEHWFIPSGPDGGILQVEGLAQTFERIALTGTVRDVLGAEHCVDEAFEDLPGFYARNAAARHVWRQDELQRTLKEKVGEPIQKELRELGRTVDRSAGRLVPSSQNGHSGQLRKRARAVGRALHLPGSWEEPEESEFVQEKWW